LISHQEAYQAKINWTVIAFAAKACALKALLFQ
jgi:hypothetical protein